MRAKTKQRKMRVTGEGRQWTGGERESERERVKERY